MSHEQLVPDRIEAALKLNTQERFASIRQAVSELIDEGMCQDDLLRHLESVRARLQANGDEATEDAVLDVMDLLVGWCSPEASLAGKRS